MGWLRRVAQVWAGRRRTVFPLVGHVHDWDVCRTYGQYRYRICLNGCGERRGC